MFLHEVRLLMSVSVLSSSNAPKDFYFLKSVFHPSLKSVFPSCLEMIAMFRDEMTLAPVKLSDSASNIQCNPSAVCRTALSLFSFFFLLITTKQ